MKRSKIRIVEANIFSDPVNVEYVPDFINQMNEVNCMGSMAMFICSILIIETREPRCCRFMKDLKS